MSEKKFHFLSYGKVPVKGQKNYSDFVFFNNSKGFPIPEEKFVDVLPHLSSFSRFEKTPGSLTACAFPMQNQPYWIYAQVQSRMEGELIGEGYTRRPYKEAYYVAIPGNRLVTPGEYTPLYASLFNRLVDKSVLKHPHPKYDRDQALLSVPLLSPNEKVPSGYVSKELGNTIPALILNYSQEYFRHLFHLLESLFEAMYDKRRVFVVTDGDKSLGIVQKFLVMDALQHLVYGWNPDKKISFSLDYFTKKTFDVTFISPQDANNIIIRDTVIEMRKVENRITVSKMNDFMHPPFDRWVVNSASYSEIMERWHINTKEIEPFLKGKISSITLMRPLDDFQDFLNILEEKSPEVTPHEVESILRNPGHWVKNGSPVSYEQYEQLLLLIYQQFPKGVAEIALNYFIDRVPEYRNSSIKYSDVINFYNEREDRKSLKSILFDAMSKFSSKFEDIQKLLQLAGGLKSDFFQASLGNNSKKFSDDKTIIDLIFTRCAEEPNSPPIRDLADYIKRTQNKLPSSFYKNPTVEGLSVDQLLELLRVLEAEPSDNSKKFVRGKCKNLDATTANDISKIDLLSKYYDRDAYRFLPEFLFRKFLEDHIQNERYGKVDELLKAFLADRKDRAFIERHLDTFKRCAKNRKYDGKYKGLLNNSDVSYYKTLLSLLPNQNSTVDEIFKNNIWRRIKSKDKLHNADLKKFIELACEEEAYQDIANYVKHHRETIQDDLVYSVINKIFDESSSVANDFDGKDLLRAGQSRPHEFVETCLRGHDRLLDSLAEAIESNYQDFADLITKHKKPVKLTKLKKKLEKRSELTPETIQQIQDEINKLVTTDKQLSDKELEELICLQNDSSDAKITSSLKDIIDTWSNTRRRSPSKLIPQVARKSEVSRYIEKKVQRQNTQVIHATTNDTFSDARGFEEAQCHATQVAEETSPKTSSTLNSSHSDYEKIKVLFTFLFLLASIPAWVIVIF